MAKSRSKPRRPPPAIENTSAAASAPSANVIGAFVEHWGMMARAWGINATMGELFALLYITGTDWTADGLRERLRVSRGNVSMNLRELMAWGVVHKVHQQGQRREFYRAETDVWTLFRRILTERKRRELDPTLQVLDRTAKTIQSSPALQSLEDRVVALQRFFALIDGLAGLLQTLDPAEIDHLVSLLKRPRGS
jgi:DNA-binding transcriptional regulator GbsR (MarR family)